MQVFRYEIPVDDEWHELKLRGPVLHVAARAATFVEIWARNDSMEPERLRNFRVFGTGHPIPSELHHVGTALAPMGLVWHLFEEVSL